MKWRWLACVVMILPSGFAYAADGVLYLVPERSVHAVGETFQIEVLANTDNAPINAAEAQLRFDPSSLEVEDISTDGSVLSSWPTPPKYSNEKGTIDFSGWANNTYTGVDGLLVTVTLKALRIGTDSVHFVSGAMLAADGKGSNVITSMRASTISTQIKDIIPAPIDATSIVNARVPASIGDDAASVLQPVFTQYQNQLNESERIIAKGKAPADSKITVWMQRGSEETQRADISSGSDGTFTYVSDAGLGIGTYHLWATAVDSDGAHTATSTVITVNVIPTGLAASAGLVSTGSFYALVIGAFGFGIGYLFRQLKGATF